MATVLGIWIGLAGVLPVLIWYDPADPQDVLVYGHQGRASDLAFMIVGAALILGAAVIGILAP